MKVVMLFIPFLSHELELTGFKEYPTEIAEVASMAMEFLVWITGKYFLQIKKN